jgi:outer membrane usher protein
MVYLRTQEPKGDLYVKWGDDANEKCNFNYDVTAQISNDQQSMIMTEAVCK